MGHMVWAGTQAVPTSRLAPLRLGGGEADRSECVDGRGKAVKLLPPGGGALTFELRSLLGEHLPHSRHQSGSGSPHGLVAGSVALRSVRLRPCLGAGMRGSGKGIAKVRVITTVHCRLQRGVLGRATDHHVGGSVVTMVWDSN